MKTLLTILILLPAFLVAQVDTGINNIFPVTNGKIIYTETVQYSSKDSAFNKFKSWILLNHSQEENSPVIDPQTAIISTPKVISLPIQIPAYKNGNPLTTQWNYNFILRIQFTQNSAVIVAENFKLQGTSNEYEFNVESFLSQSRSLEKAVKLNKAYQQKFEASVYDNYRLLNSKVKDLIDELAHTI